MAAGNPNSQRPQAGWVEFSTNDNNGFPQNAIRTSLERVTKNTPIQGEAQESKRRKRQLISVISFRVDAKTTSVRTDSASAFKTFFERETPFVDPFLWLGGGTGDADQGNIGMDFEHPGTWHVDRIRAFDNGDGTTRITGTMRKEGDITEDA